MGFVVGDKAYFMSREVVTRTLPVERNTHLLAMMAGDSDSAAMMDRDS